MGKNNSTFGKLLAFTTTVAAIGGACYIFRDQIKESSIYQKASDKFDVLRKNMKNKHANDDEDFFFDDEFEDDFEDDVFTDDAKLNREYTSITINPKEENESSSENTQSESIPTISVGKDASDNKVQSSATEEVSGYENEGLSDVSEDPDTLADMDKLDM